LTFGVLVTAVALLVPGVAQAQPDPPGSIESTPVNFDSILVSWQVPGDLADVTGYEVGYAIVPKGQTTPGADTFGLLGPTIKSVTPAAATQTQIDDLNHSKSYFIAARSVDSTATEATERMSVWVVLQTMARTQVPAALPQVVDVKVTPLNGALMAVWDDVNDPSNIGIHHFKLTAKSPAMTVVQGSAGDVTEHQITGLTNGTEYTVTVQAVGENPDGSADIDGDGTPERLGPASKAVKATPSATADDPMTPTPALPLFGILALFAGLLAAGRARLRR
jgi:hypothetical protein